MTGSSELLARMKGGHLWTVLLNQRAAASLGSWAAARGLRPNQISMANLVLGLGTSASVVALSHRSSIAAGVVAFAGWQLAYTFDCADGMLARATNSTSPAGYLIDLICDYLVQFSVVVAMVTVAAPSMPTGTLGVAVAGLLVGAYLIGVYSSALGSAANIGHRASTSLAKEIARTVLRDYGSQVAFYAIAIGIGSGATMIAVGAMACSNALFLAIRLTTFVRSGIPVAS